MTEREAQPGGDGRPYICPAAMRTVSEMEGHLAEQAVTVVPTPFHIDRLVREIGARL
ncbi:MAG: hypothetical protein M3Q10_08575 [Chloroflexota bacterium]|nr:hypothetical protein [Chloroflexota bacterium]